MLTVNALIEWISNEEQTQSIIERILWLDRISDLAYVVDVKSDNLPYTRSADEYNEAIVAGAAISLDRDPFLKIVDELTLSDKTKYLRDRAWETISSIVVLEPEIYQSRERSKYVRAIAKKYGVTEKVVFKYLKRYWIRGKTINALLPDFDLCGGRGKEKGAKDKKRGRPRKYEDIVGTGINIDDDIKRIFQVAINRFYYNSAKHSLTVTYELMRREYFVEGYRVEDGKKMALLKPSSEVPTFGQFHYWYEKERSIKREISSRFSSKKYEQEYRPVLGSSSADAIGPGSVYMIDTTVADVYLVSRFNRTHIIGRPFLTIVQDMYSRLIVGLSISLDSESYLGASIALANSFSNKIDFCKSVRINIQEEDWPAHHIPLSILADRGVMMSCNAENIVKNLGITIKNTPPYRGDWKPLIERYFKLTNERTKSFLPGAINPDFRERGAKDYRLDAKLDMMEFTQIIIKCILFHNNQYRLVNLNKDEIMISDEVEPIAREIWNWGLANRIGKLRQFDEEIVKLNLMPMGEGVVTAKGIRFNGLFYSSKSSMKEQWFTKARSGGSWRVPISYNPRNMDYIYVRKSQSAYEKCYLLEYQTAFKDKFAEEIEYMMEWEKVQKIVGKDEGLQAKTDLITEIESIVKEAKSQTDKELFLSNESDTQRKKNIRENRRSEKESYRDLEAFELDKYVENKNVEVIPFEKQEKPSSNIMELLRRKQREAFGDGSNK